MAKLRDRTEVDRTAAVIALAISALADALWKSSQMTSEDIALDILKAGATGACEILRY